jgi:nitrite reductase/ring-hydroxylating ferredoxin subunit
MRFPLKGGQIHDGAIVCPFHHSAFDLDSGDVKEWSPWPPGLGPVLASLSRKKVLRTYEVKIEDGAIFIRPRLSGESGMVI